jgi:hypothetical protein
MTLSVLAIREADYPLLCPFPFSLLAEREGMKGVGQITPSEYIHFFTQ